MRRDFCADFCAGTFAQTFALGLLRRLLRRAKRTTDPGVIFAGEQEEELMSGEEKSNFQETLR